MHRVKLLMKKSDYKFAECVIIMLSLGYHLLQSQKQGFVFSEKSFLCFQGVQSAPMGRRHVPFWGILVSKINVLPFSGGAMGLRHVPFLGILVYKINVLPFSGGATGDGSGAACPFLGVSCFKNKCFAVFRTWNRWFRPKPAQNCIIIYAHVPFWDILILNLNDLPKSGHATLCAFS